MKHSQKGFTLIEVSLALLISVGVITGVGYLYKNAAAQNFGLTASSEAISALALCQAQESSLNSGCNPIIETGSQVVSAIQTAAPNVSTPLFAIQFTGPLTYQLGGPTGGISTNACYIAYSQITAAGYQVTAGGTTGYIVPTTQTTAISQATACPASTAVVAFIVKQAALN